MQVSTQSIHIFMAEIRCQKTMKYKENLSTKLLFPQKDENALTTLLHSADDLFSSVFDLFNYILLYLYFLSSVLL